MLELAEFILDIFDVHFNFMKASIKVATFSFVLKKDIGFYKRRKICNPCSFTVESIYNAVLSSITKSKGYEFHKIGK